MSAQPSTFEFKSEARQLLDLVIHSLYSHKDVFLRELISNASDALDRLRFEALTDTSIDAGDLEIHIEPKVHEAAGTRTLVITDNGIGMSREEVVENLGTIARSGTKAFMEALSDQQKAEQEGAAATMESLIGQFGVGFYSAFMVAGEVTVITRKAGTEEATRWHSAGDGAFTVESTTREAHGTTIILHLREADPENDLEDFTQDHVIRRTIKKYSDFVTYPIKLRTEREERERDEEGNLKEDGEVKTVVEWPVVNSMKAIWTRRPADVTDEEYTEFYKHISHDWTEPLERVSIRTEGTFQYSALLFIPENPPFDLYYRDIKYGLQLYVNRVLIMERCEDLLPSWMRFVKGVVDSPDLSLNVSREMLQEDRRVAQIRKRVVKKTIDTLKTLKKDDREKYEKFWQGFGQVLKEGVATDFDARGKLDDLLLFESSRHETEVTDLAGYVERMPEDQEAIYYITGERRSMVENSPHLEALKARGYEVLFLTDPVDEIMVGQLTEFDGKPVKSVGKGEVEVGTEEERKAAEEARSEKQKTHASLLEFLQKALDEKVREVRLSNRLKDSAVCLVGGEHDMSPQMERILRSTGQEAPVVKRILELNPEHPVLTTMQRLYDANADDPQLADFTELLYGQALLAEGSPLPDPANFSRLVARLMVVAG
ncbi:MAG: molecular chaperone HtpG [Bradymonadia bacterium]